MLQASRLLFRRPAFSVLAASIIGLGVGAVVTIATMIDVLLVRPLPFPDADRLVLVRTKTGNDVGKIALREYRLLQQETRLFEGLAAYYPSQYNLPAGAGGAPEALPATICTANLFDVLGARPIAGAPWPAAVDFHLHFPVVLGHGLWQRAFGGDPKIVGKSVELDRHAYEVVGIAPPLADFPDRTDIFRSITDFDTDDARRLGVVGRLRAGVTPAQAAAEIDALGRVLAARYPETNAGVRLTIDSLRDASIGDSRVYLTMLAVAAALIVLLTCANVGNLLLARALERQTEIAVRRALGATTASLARQLISEGLWLAVPASIVGVLVATIALRVLSALVQFKLPVWLRIEPGASTIVMVLGCSIGAAIASSLVPLVQLSRGDDDERLKTGSRGSAGRRERRMLRTLAALQSALAIALLVYAGLLTRTVWRLLDTPLGFEPARLLTLRIDPPWGRYPDIRTTSEFYRRSIELLEQLPGVQGAAANQNLPLGRLPDGVTQTVFVEGDAISRVGEQPFVNVQPVSPRYFDVMRIGRIAGRDFTERDREDTVPVAIVNASLAQRYWPGQQAVGKRLRLASASEARLYAPIPNRSAAPRSPWLMVVGVVGDVRHEHVAGATGLDVYLPHTQTYSGDSYLVIRTATEPRALIAAATRAIRTVDPEQSTFAVAPMTDIVDRVIWQQRLVGSVFAAFAVLALVLALAGVHGMVAQDVVRRTREIGVRLALGATARAVTRMMVSESSGAVLPGSLGGLLAVAALARASSSVLYQISPFDPIVYATAFILVSGASVVTALWASRRASSISPLTAMRSE
jgi:putative ABC transport system permease protein